jgi:hypothetical protein
MEMSSYDYDHDTFWRRYSLRHGVYLSSKCTMLGICGYCCAAESFVYASAFFFFLLVSEIFNPQRMLMQENIKVLKKLIEINRRLWDGVSNKGKD